MTTPRKGGGFLLISKAIRFVKVAFSITHPIRSQDRNSVAAPLPSKPVRSFSRPIRPFTYSAFQHTSNQYAPPIHGCAYRHWLDRKIGNSGNGRPSLWETTERKSPCRKRALAVISTRWLPFWGCSIAIKSADWIGVGLQVTVTRGDNSPVRDGARYRQTTLALSNQLVR